MLQRMVTPAAFVTMYRVIHIVVVVVVADFVGVPTVALAAEFVTGSVVMGVPDAFAALVFVLVSAAFLTVEVAVAPAAIIVVYELLTVVAALFFCLVSYSLVIEEVAEKIKNKYVRKYIS